MQYAPSSAMFICQCRRRRTTPAIQVAKLEINDILHEWCWCDGRTLHVCRLKIVHFIVANHTPYAPIASRLGSTLDNVMHAELLLMDVSSKLKNTFEIMFISLSMAILQLMADQRRIVHFCKSVHVSE